MLEEFCSLLLLTRFSVTDDSLIAVQRVEHNVYINSQHARTQENPLEQNDRTCYAYAIAGVVHIALSRIVGCDCPESRDICERIC